MFKFCRHLSLKMAALIFAVVLICVTAGSASGLQCYECTYTYNPWGLGQSCITPTFNDTPSVVECETSCQLSVLLQNDGTIFTLSRGCADNETISCCQNLNTQMRCTDVCDDRELCNNATYDASSSVNDLTRCELPAVDGAIPCNSCVYSGGSSDTSCLYHPDTGRVGIVQCFTNTSECTVKSMRPIADESFVWSYQRGCHPIGSMTPYGRSEDSVYITWICHCNTEYCNDNTEDGTEAECHPQNPPGGGGGGDGGDGGDGGFDVGFSQLRQRNDVIIVLAVVVGLLINFLSQNHRL